MLVADVCLHSGGDGVFGSVASFLESRKYIHTRWTVSKGEDCST